LFEKEIKISVVMWGFEPRSSLWESWCSTNCALWTIEKMKNYF
jgi:hypothetical protein